MGHSSLFKCIEILYIYQHQLLTLSHDLKYKFSFNIQKDVVTMPAMKRKKI